MLFKVLPILLLLTLCCFILSDKAEAADKVTTESKANKLTDSIFQEISNSRSINTQEEFEKYILTSDSSVIMFFYRNGGRSSRIMAHIFKKIMKNLAFLVDILMVDCETSYGKTRDHCALDKVDPKKDVPRFVLLRPPVNRVNPYTKKLETHQKVDDDLTEYNRTSIYKFITKNIFTNSYKLDEDTIDQFLDHPGFNKVILFTEKPEAPLLIRGLSNLYHDRLVFGTINVKNERLVNRFKVKYIPSIMVYQTVEDNIALEQPKTGFYQGDMDKKKIMMFLDLYALPMKHYVAHNQGTPIAPINFPMINSDTYEFYFRKKFERNIIVYFSNKGLSDVAAKVPEELQEFANMNCGYYFFAHMDCSGSHEDTCKRDFNVNEYPSMRLYNSNEYLKSSELTQRLHNESTELPLNTNELSNVLFNDFKNDYLFNGTAENLPKVLALAKKNKKLPILHLLEGDSINLGFTILSSKPEFSDVFSFIILHNPHKDVLKQLQIEKLPAMITLNVPDKDTKDAQIQISRIQGELSYRNVKEFLSGISRTIKPKSAHEYNYGKAELEYYNTSVDLKSNCLFSKKDLCIINMIDGRIHRKEYLETFDKNIEMSEKMINKFNGKYYNFGWVNATCHEELVNSFNISPDMIPSLIVYNPAKNSFANMIGSYTEEGLGDFISNVANGKTAMTKIDPKKIDMRLKKCENIIEAEIDESDDQIMKEIKEELRLKREKFEHERKKDL